MKNLKHILLLLFSIIILSSCFWNENIEIVDEEVIIENVQSGNKLVIDKKLDKEIEEEIKNTYSKYVEKAEKGDTESFNKWLKLCEENTNPEACKKRFILKEWKKQKNIELCKYLDDRKEIEKCKYKIVSNLVSRELDPKYCDLLDEFWKNDCLVEYQSSLDIEKENIINMK